MDEPDNRSAALGRAAQEARADAIALSAQSFQSRRHASELRQETNAILDQVAEIVARTLKARGIYLREPVAARFRTQPGRSTGLELVLRVEDPRHADAAKVALAEDFPDPLTDVLIS